jgi:hypothetical protein
VLFDCVLFGGELDLLEGRLHTLDPHVDYFVITEADYQFQGQHKGYILDQEWGRFSMFHNKIIYIRVESYRDKNPWVNEIQQRRAAEWVLKGMSDSDIITVCDVDEWWNPALFPTDDEVVAFNMPKYHLSLHWYHKHELTGVGGRWSYFKDKDLDHERRMMRHTFPAITGGAHFTTMGDFDFALRKMQGFAHSEFNGPELERDMKLFWETGRFYHDVFQEIEFDENTPAWVTDRRFPASWYRRRHGAL